MELMSSEAGTAEEIAKSLIGARSLLSDSSDGYSIFHSHAKRTIYETVADSPQRLGFYAKRLAKWFSSKHDFTAAFTVLDSAGADVSPKLLSLAQRHATIQGDTTATLTVLNRRIKIAAKENNPNELQNLMLSLADVQGHTGQTEEALKTLDEIRKLPKTQEPFIPIDEVQFSILSWSRGDPTAIEGLNAAKQLYLEKGQDWDAARMALNLSGSYIRAGDYLKAAIEAEFALDVFTKYNDQYGAGLAKINLLSASSEIPEKADLAAMLLKELESKAATSPRQRAVLFNVLTKQARRNDDIEGAKSYARQAIQIGRELGDLNVVCINMMNLGNAFRQEGNLDEALEQYEAADNIASECDFVQSEAWVQELMADVFNRKGDGRRAIHHARYAIGLAKGGVSRRTEGEAYEDLAEACELIKDFVGARNAWLELAQLELDYDRESEFGLQAFLRASRLLYNGKARSAYIDAYRRVFSGQINIAGEGLSNIEILANELPSLLTSLPVGQVFEATVYHARLLFDGLPKVMVRQLYLYVMRHLTRIKNDEVDDTRILRAVLALTMALPPDTLLTPDIVDIGGNLSRHNPCLSFRAHTDGAAHWAINAPFAKPVIVTLSQLDDRRDVGLVCLCLALLLASFAHEISAEILVDLVPPRDEAHVYLVNYDQAKNIVPLEKAGLHSMEDRSAVTRATDPKDKVQAPIVVITRSDITSDWLVGVGRGEFWPNPICPVLG